ncbi:MAG: hypothetical protein WEC59_00310 [Salibacteraceae bacterium]
MVKLKKQLQAGTLIESLVSLVIISLLGALTLLLFDNAYGALKDNLEIEAEIYCELAVVTGKIEHSDRFEVMLVVQRIHHDVDRVIATAVNEKGDTICSRYGLVLKK